MRRAPMLALAACAALSCEAIIGADFGDAKPLLTDGGRPEGSGGSTPSLEGGSAGATTGGATTSSMDAGECVLVVSPERPNIPPASGDLDVILVMNTVDYGDRIVDGRPEYLDLGYDVDGLCSGSGRDGPGCTPPDWLSLDLEDGNGGQDSAVGKLLLSQNEFFGTALISSAQLNENVAAGVDAPLGVLRIQGFAGLGDDDDVEVDWFVVAPFGSAPTFTATDVWTAVDALVTDPAAATAVDTVSSFRDPDAFVTQRRLVARFSNAVIPLLNVNFDVDDIVLTGNLTRDLTTGVWSIEDGVISGTSSGNDLLRVIPLIAEASFGVSLCSDDAANYPTIKTFVCSGADLPEAGAGPETPCLRTSVGARFTTAPATLGDIGPGPPQESLCPPETDPANDTCTVPPP